MHPPDQLPAPKRGQRGKRPEGTPKLAKVVIDAGAVATLLRGPTGPVARALLVVGERIKVRTIASLKPGFPQDFLGPRIVKRMVPGGPSGLTCLVGTDKTRTQPHIITGNPLLVFPGRDGGTVFVHQVNHPGSDFTAYLQEKLEAATATMKGI